MTTEQMDWADANARRIQQQGKQPQFFELVQQTSGGDFRESWTEEKIISVHATEIGALKAGLKSNFIVRPLKVKD